MSELTPRSLHPMVSFVLTKHVPCAVLALLMLTSLVWLPMLFAGLPILAVLLSFVAVALHMLVPALFGLIFMGGGVRYALTVSGIVALAVVLLSGMNVLMGVVVGLFYCVLPVLAARNLRQMGGLNRSATQLGIGVFIAVLTALWFGGQSQDVGMHAFVDQLLAPMFASMQQAEAQLSTETLQPIRELLSWGLPGLIAFSLWVTWWMDVVLARHIAMRYGFYTGDTAALLSLRFGKMVGYAAMLALIVANVDAGILQYVSISLAVLLAGALSIQGISVVHVWLKARQMQAAIVMMYVLLFLWTMMVIPFIVLGLLDIWFDYRRNNNPIIGG